MMASSRGLLLLLLVVMHLGSPLERDAAHPTQPGQRQELDLPSWGPLEEEPSYLVAFGSQLSYEEGSLLTLEARVLPPLHTTMKLYVDACVGSQGPTLSHSQRVFSLVFNQGCLSIGPTSGGWSRKASESLQFRVVAFMLRDNVDEDEVYITCWVKLWSWMRPFEPGRKSCVFNTTSNSWQLSEDAAKSQVCECCDFGCYYPTIEQHEFPEEGEPYMMVVGPVRVRKLPAPWFKAPCRRLKDLLLVGLAFSGVTALLIFLLVTFVLLGLREGCRLGFWGSRLRWALARLEPKEMEPVVMRRFSSQGLNDGVSHPNIEENEEAVDAAEDD